MVEGGVSDGGSVWAVAVMEAPANLVSFLCDLIGSGR